MQTDPIGDTHNQITARDASVPLPGGEAHGTGAPRAPGQHICLQVDDLDPFLERLTAHGVDARETHPIPGRPRRVVHDPFGNQIEISQIAEGT